MDPRYCAEWKIAHRPARQIPNLDPIPKDLFTILQGRAVTFLPCFSHNALPHLNQRICCCRLPRWTRRAAELLVCKEPSAAAMKVSCIHEEMRDTRIVTPPVVTIRALPREIGTLHREIIWPTLTCTVHFHRHRRDFKAADYRLGAIARRRRRSPSLANYIRRGAQNAAEARKSDTIHSLNVRARMPSMYRIRGTNRAARAARGKRPVAGRDGNGRNAAVSSELGETNIGIPDIVMSTMTSTGKRACHD